MKKQMCACWFYIFNYLSTVGGEVLLLSSARLFELTGGSVTAEQGNTKLGAKGRRSAVFGGAA